MIGLHNLQMDGITERYSSVVCVHPLLLTR
jgi:hypothetical protein